MGGGRGWATLRVAPLVLTLVAGAVRAESPEPGKPAPVFTLPDLSGKPVRLEDLRGKKAVLVNFWATWCAPCREEMLTLERLFRDRRETLEVLAVSLDAVGPDRVRAFVRELRLGFPVLVDPESRVGALYRVRALPGSFVLDRDGIVRHREIGYRDWASAASQRIIDDALRPR